MLQPSWALAPMIPTRILSAALETLLAGCQGGAAPIVWRKPGARPPHSPPWPGAGIGVASGTCAPRRRGRHSIGVRAILSTGPKAGPASATGGSTSGLDALPHQCQEPLLNDGGLEGHLQIPCLVGTERGVLVELLDQGGDECLHLGLRSLISHPARRRYGRFLEHTLYVHGEQLVLHGLPLHVANDLEVVAQITATEIHDIPCLVFKRVGSLHLGDQLMRVEVRFDSFVLRVRVLLAEGEEHRIHKERLGLYLYPHFLPLAFPRHLTRLRSWERPVSNTSQAYSLMTSASSVSRRCVSWQRFCRKVAF